MSAPTRKPPGVFAARYVRCGGCDQWLLDAEGRGVHPNPVCDPTPWPWWTPEQMAVWLATAPTQDTPDTAPGVAVEHRTERAA